MAKLESTFINMLVVLCGITVISGTALGGMYKLTEAPIAAAEKAKQVDAIKLVAPEFDNAPAEEKYDVTLEDGSVLTIFPAKKEGKWVGAAIESFTKKGFAGEIKIMVGFEADGTIRNYSVLKHAETPGLGSKMEMWFRGDKANQSIIGKNSNKNKLTVSKEGGDIDAITAATISSRAFLDAVQRADHAYRNNTNIQSSATTKVETDTVAAQIEKEETSHE